MDMKTLSIAIAVGIAFLALPLLVSLKTPPAPPAVVDLEEIPSGDPVSETTEQEAANAVMTRTQFGQIRSGMTYEQCLAVAGTPGNPVAPGECQSQGAESGYTWLDPSGEVEFRLMFRGGRVMGLGFGQPVRIQQQMAAAIHAEAARTRILTEEEVRPLEQAAIQGGQPVSVTLAEFQYLRPGSTYEECVAIIGEENPMARAYAGQRNAAMAGSQTLTEAYKWPNPGGYYAELAFQNGRLTQKTWKRGSASGGGSARGTGGHTPWQ